MLKWILQYIFLIIAVGSLLIPSFYYWIYPRPQNIIKQEAELEKLYNGRVEHIQKAIEIAKKHQGGWKVYGGAEPWRQAERDEMTWQEKLNEEQVEYKNKIKELDKFPWTNAFVLVGIFLTALGLHFMHKSHNKP